MHSQGEKNIQSNHLFTHAYQFSCWAINKPPGPEILAVWTKSWLGRTTVWTGRLTICQVKQQVSGPSCFEIFLDTMRLNAAVNDSHLFSELSRTKQHTGGETG